jgi:hypothetical protein
MVVFYLLAFMSMASLVSILSIPERAIDHELARGLHDSGETTRGLHEQERPSGLSVLLTCRPLLIFAVCVALFHLSNAAMLPLVGQKLALQEGAVITAQGIGAALSTTLAGIVVVKAGYDWAFLTLGAVAAFAVLVCYFGLAETGGSESSASSGGAAVSSKLAAG